MINNIISVDLLDIFKSGVVGVYHIKLIIEQYHKYPQYIIKYITLNYPKECAEEIIKYISTTNEQKCELIEYILASYSIKLCDIPFMREISCIDECICNNRDCWKYIYNNFITLISSDLNYFLSNYNIKLSFTSLIAKTDVQDEKLFIMIGELVKSPKNWKSVIKFITDCELYGSDYGDIIFMMRDMFLANDKLEERKKNKLLSDNQCRLMLGIALHKYNDMQQNMSKITDNIYITDISGVKNVSIIKDSNIRYIISITKKSIFKIENIEYTQIYIDDIGSVNFIDETLETADKVVKYINTNNNILVHCYRGLSRSVCFVILVLIRSGMKFNEAYNIVLSGRIIIDPNPEFIKQIENFVQNLNKKNIEI
jgi:predicted protein tyrosine phosphatase